MVKPPGADGTATIWKRSGEAFKTMTKLRFLWVETLKALRMEAFPKKKTQGSRGGFLKWWVWYPHFTPQVLIILLGKPMGQLGKPTIVGNPHML